ncbi:MAG: hypothetical protein RLZZ373_3215 [Pseudomonadota bacterium]
MNGHNSAYKRATMTTGEEYTPKPASGGLCNDISCIRCHRLVPVSATKPDTVFRYQRRCADTVACKQGRSTGQMRTG